MFVLFSLLYMAVLLLYIYRKMLRPFDQLREPIPQAQVTADAKRLAQVIENILNNARKYAPGARVEVWGEADDTEYRIHIRDYGAGIPPEDMPFICNKFYRGHNAGEQPGSGLGLYIVKYILERMHGQPHGRDGGVQGNFYCGV